MRIQIESGGLGVRPLLWQSEPLEALPPTTIDLRASWKLPLPLSQLHALDLAGFNADLSRAGQQLAETQSSLSMGEYLRQHCAADIGLRFFSLFEPSPPPALAQMPFHVALPLSELAAGFTSAEARLFQALPEVAQATSTRLQQLFPGGLFAQNPQDLAPLRNFESSSAGRSARNASGARQEATPEEYLQERRGKMQQRSRSLSQLLDRLRDMLKRLNLLAHLRH